MGRAERSGKKKYLDSTLVAAAFALIGAITGGVIAACATSEQVDTQVQQGLNAESRTQKIKAYTDYMDAVEEFTTPLMPPGDVDNWTQPGGIATPVGTPPSPPAPTDSPTSTNPQIVPTPVAERVKLKTIENEVYVYGTDDAWAKADALYAFLTQFIADAAKDPKTPFDAVQYTALSRGFRSVVCKEAPAKPRTNC
jgi:hypothetical protein